MVVFTRPISDWVLRDCAEVDGELRVRRHLDVLGWRRHVELQAYEIARQRLSGSDTTVGFGTPARVR
jgi:hypothetical protein